MSVPGFMVIQYLRVPAKQQKLLMVHVDPGNNGHLVVALVTLVSGLGHVSVTTHLQAMVVNHVQDKAVLQHNAIHKHALK
jgi:hypothetical protein